MWTATVTPKPTIKSLARQAIRDTVEPFAQEHGVFEGAETVLQAPEESLTVRQVQKTKLHGEIQRMS